MRDSGFLWVSLWNSKFGLEVFLLKLYAFLLPFEFVFTMGASGLFKGLLGSLYFSIQPSFLLPCFLLINRMFSIQALKIKKSFFLILSLFFFVGYFEVVASLYVGEGVRYALQQLWFGFLGPIIFIIFLCRYDVTFHRLIFTYFYLGYFLFFIIALFVLILDGVFTELYVSRGLASTVISFRYQYEDSLFHLLLGNFNKQSNYVILTLLFGPYLLLYRNDVRKFPLRLYNSFFMLAILFLVLMFSRAALLILPFVIYANREYLFFWNRRVACIMSVIALFFLVFLWNDIETIFGYLIFSNYIDGTSRGFIGSFEQRYDQWSTLPSMFSDDKGLIITGMGVGSYGTLLFGNASSGTHNLFLDHLMSSGLISFLLLSIIICLGIWRSFYHKQLALMLIIPVFIGLSFREYSFSYHYLTSLGGFFFLLAYYLLFYKKDVHNKMKIYSSLKAQ